MFKKDTTGAVEKSGIGKETGARGTTDDLEILKIAIMENKGLYMRVLDKLRAAKAANKASLQKKGKTE